MKLSAGSLASSKLVQVNTRINVMILGLFSSIISSNNAKCTFYYVLDIAERLQYTLMI